MFCVIRKLFKTFQPRSVACEHGSLHEMWHLIMIFWHPSHAGKAYENWKVKGGNDVFVCGRDIIRGGTQQHYSILSIFNFNKNNIMIVLNFFYKT